MIQDPDNRYIKEINRHAPLQGRAVLEIGCGSGRITRDILRFTDQVVATDTDDIALRKAASRLAGAKIELLHTPSGKADLPKSSFDIVIYSLSLHHVPAEKMCDNLYHSGSLLKKNGKIVVLEPGERGSFLELKQRFGAGSGDESSEKRQPLQPWTNYRDGGRVQETASTSTYFLPIWTILSRPSFQTTGNWPTKIN